MCNQHQLGAWERFDLFTENADQRMRPSSHGEIPLQFTTWTPQAQRDCVRSFC